MTITLDQLPFAVKKSDGTYDLWNFAYPPDYGAACSLGRQFAYETIDAIGNGCSPSILGLICSDMATKRPNGFGGVEIGFLAIFAERASARP